MGYRKISHYVYMKDDRIIEMKQETIERIKNLMQLKLDNNKNSKEQLFSVTFFSGETIKAFLRSSETEYYIELVLMDKEGEDIKSERIHEFKEIMSIVWSRNTYVIVINTV